MSNFTKSQTGGHHVNLLLFYEYGVRVCWRLPQWPSWMELSHACVHGCRVASHLPPSRRSRAVVFRVKGPAECDHKSYF
jgi:hypothetical protein